MSEIAVDVLLVGGGIMSATLATLLAHLDPGLKVLIVERQPAVAMESTDAWNNAGTGHAGYCELNYTPQDAMGNIGISRALAINAAFEVSLQFWAYLVEKGELSLPGTFINAVPHESFVWGEKDTAFLRERQRLLSQHHLFEDMEYSNDQTLIRDWMPLVMQNRDAKQVVAATRVAYGTDIDFGALTRQMVSALQASPNFELHLGHEVKRLEQKKNGHWQVSLLDKKNGKIRKIDADSVFLGAGGGTLPLLQKSGIPEGKGYGGFPVSGQWLVCKNPEIIRQHRAKVYGKAPLGAPPMSLPHLDTRYINGQPALLFGPYAGFSTRFLKRGSLLDLAASIKINNLRSMAGAGWHNTDLTRYLIGEVFQGHESRIEALRKFYPDAKSDEWQLATAGQRVQVIKRCGRKWGRLEFGTEIVTSSDGSMAALLGASPGASTSVQAMLQVLERCFSRRTGSADWQGKLREMVPSYGDSLVENAVLMRKIRQRNLEILGLLNKNQ